MHLMSTDLKTRLKSRLKQVRKNQIELAASIGMENPQNITHWNRRGEIPLKWLDAVARELECDPRWLQTGEGIEQPEKNTRTIDVGALAVIIEGVYAAVSAVGLEWGARQVAVMVANLYELYEETGETPASFDQLVRLQDLASKSTR